MNSQLIVGLVEAAFGRILDGAVHPLDLTFVQDGVDPIGDSLDQASQEVRGRGRITFSCSSTKANFDVRSMATMR